MLRAFAEASCKLSIVDEMRVVRSEAHGKWSADDARQNLADIKNLAATFGGKKWAFMGVLTDMAPVGPEASKVFSSFHEEFDKINCAAITFVVGGKVAIKAQTQRHHDISAAADKLVIRHFNDEKSALEWIKSLNVV